MTTKLLCRPPPPSPRRICRRHSSPCRDCSTRCCSSTSEGPAARNCQRRCRSCCSASAKSFSTTSSRSRPLTWMYFEVPAAGIGSRRMLSDSGGGRRKSPVRPCPAGPTRRSGRRGRRARPCLPWPPPSRTMNSRSGTNWMRRRTAWPPGRRFRRARRRCARGSYGPPRTPEVRAGGRCRGRGRGRAPDRGRAPVLAGRHPVRPSSTRTSLPDFDPPPSPAREERGRTASGPAAAAAAVVVPRRDRRPPAPSSRASEA
mmetsp:Transcript_40677/g.122489  ORF Transcript_40677/g.122489 Transcript_40677/m.122489 type:complete len:258 (+) Transcript_40677:2288-3061(+)